VGGFPKASGKNVGGGVPEKIQLKVVDSADTISNFWNWLVELYERRDFLLSEERTCRGRLQNGAKAGRMLP